MVATNLPHDLPHGAGDASAWVHRWSHLVREGGTVLDIACGHGRHMKFFAQSGHRVTGVDRSADAIAAIAQQGEAILADIENGAWPLMQAGQLRTFAAVIVTNYLWRALFPVIAQSLAPGGVLMYETFASGNETVGKPSRPDFLLQPGELLRSFAGLHIVAYENGYLPSPARFVQRLVAVREPRAAEPGQPARHPL